MSLPIAALNLFNSGGQNVTLTATAPITTAPDLNPNVQIGPQGLVLLYDASFYVFTAGTGWTVTFQELGLDGVWKNLGTPAPIVATSNQAYNGSFPGEFLGLRITSTVAGSSQLYAMLKAATRTGPS